MWTVRFRNGQTKRFKYPIRTTPWGSIEPHAGLPAADLTLLKAPGVCGQDKYLGVPQLPGLATV
jgi:adenylylsulfate reductase subunit B